MRNYLLILGLYTAVFFATAAEKPVYTVGTQSISYKPHYDFGSPETDSFAEALLQLFATEHNLEFKVVVLPTKRLNIAAEVDFIYPDNPLWRQEQQHQNKLFFSQPVVHILGATMVPLLRQHLPLNKIKTIAVPRGFTPEHLLKVQADYGFSLVETPDAESALKMVLLGRVDAADVELNVANFLLAQLRQPKALVPGSALPFARVGFHLSSARHPQLIKAFDLFLISHQQQITALKQQYQLQEEITE